MSDILERARQKQREEAHGCTIVIRLDFLQEMITEIERLRLDVKYPPRAIGAVLDIHALNQMEEKKP